MSALLNNQIIWVQVLETIREDAANVKNDYEMQEFIKDLDNKIARVSKLISEESEMLDGAITTNN